MWISHEEDNSEGRIVKHLSPEEKSKFFDEKGNFKKGHKGLPGTGRKPGMNLRRAVKERFAEKPDFLDYNAAVQNLLAAGIIDDPNSEELPRDFDTVEALWTRVWQLRSMAGSVEHTKEILDRADPKPNKITLDANINARAAIGVTDVDDEGARKWYDALDPAGDDSE